MQDTSCGDVGGERQHSVSHRHAILHRRCLSRLGEFNKGRDRNEPVKLDRKRVRYGRVMQRVRTKERQVGRA